MQCLKTIFLSVIALSAACLGCRKSENATADEILKLVGRYVGTSNVHSIKADDGPPPHTDTTYSFSDTLIVCSIASDSIGIVSSIYDTNKFAYDPTNSYKCFVYGGSGYGTTYEVSFKPGTDSLEYKKSFGLNKGSVYMSSKTTFRGIKR